MLGGRQPREEGQRWHCPTEKVKEQGVFIVKVNIGPKPLKAS
jgi:hypothetical protein